MAEIRPRIGIQIAPDIMATIFRSGVSIITPDGVRINLIEGGVPADYLLQKYGVDPQTRQVIFIFKPPGPGSSCPVEWHYPTYQKEEGDGANP